MFHPTSLLASLLGATTLLGAPGIATRSKDATRGLNLETIYKPTNCFKLFFELGITGLDRNNWA